MPVKFFDHIDDRPGVFFKRMGDAWDIEKTALLPQIFTIVVITDHGLVCRIVQIFLFENFLHPVGEKIAQGKNQVILQMIFYKIFRTIFPAGDRILDMLRNVAEVKVGTLESEIFSALHQYLVFFLYDFQIVERQEKFIFLYPAAIFQCFCKPWLKVVDDLMPRAGIVFAVPVDHQRHPDIRAVNFFIIEDDSCRHQKNVILFFPVGRLGQPAAVLDESAVVYPAFIHQFFQHVEKDIGWIKIQLADMFIQRPIKHADSDTAFRRAVIKYEISAAALADDQFPFGEPVKCPVCGFGRNGVLFCQFNGGWQFYPRHHPAGDDFLFQCFGNIYSMNFHFTGSPCSEIKYSMGIIYLCKLKKQPGVFAGRSGKSSPPVKSYDKKTAYFIRNCHITGYEHQGNIW